MNKIMGFFFLKRGSYALNIGSEIVLKITTYVQNSLNTGVWFFLNTGMEMQSC